MEIVSYGHVKPQEEFCSKCGATLKYLPRDVDTWQPGTTNAKFFIRCPVCGSVIFVDITFAKNDKYVTFADVDEVKDDAEIVNIKDLPFMQADVESLANNKAHDDHYIAWEAGYLACLKAVQKQVLEAAENEQKGTRG